MCQLYTGLAALAAGLIIACAPVRAETVRFAASCRTPAWAR